MSTEKQGKTFSLTKVHEANLKMLTEIDRICGKYKIQYCLDSGTLLGAIRHGGFIPWDDDADVMFTRNNYEMFVKVVRRELPKGMTFVEPNEYHGGKAFYDFASRILYDKSQKYEESGKMAFYDDKISKLCVDIFVVDDLPKGAFAKKLTKFLHCVVYGLALGHRYRISYSDYRGIMKLFVFVLSHIGACIPFPAIYKIWKVLCVKDRNKNAKTGFYTSYAPDYYYVEVEKEWVDHVLRAAFEDKVLLIPSEWQGYLTQVYGDYLKLPPEEKRIPEHSDMEIKIHE